MPALFLSYQMLCHRCNDPTRGSWTILFRCCGCCCLHGRVGELRWTVRPFTITLIKPLLNTVRNALRSLPVYFARLSIGNIHDLVVIFFVWVHRIIFSIVVSSDSINKYTRLIQKIQQLQFSAPTTKTRAAESVAHEPSDGASHESPQCSASCNLFPQSEHVLMESRGYHVPRFASTQASLRHADASGSQTLVQLGFVIYQIVLVRLGVRRRTVSRHHSSQHPRSSIALQSELETRPQEDSVSRLIIVQLIHGSPIHHDRSLHDVGQPRRQAFCFFHRQPPNNGSHTITRDPSLHLQFNLVRCPPRSSRRRRQSAHCSKNIISDHGPEEVKGNFLGNGDADRVYPGVGIHLYVLLLGRLGCVHLCQQLAYGADGLLLRQLVLPDQCVARLHGISDRFVVLSNTWECCSCALFQCPLDGPQHLPLVGVRQSYPYLTESNLEVAESLSVSLCTEILHSGEDLTPHGHDHHFPRGAAHDHLVYW
mmetsp:Transcript_29362/g.66851  ORF Transcript_29362/g.66851 Transcript_29362/m.66851 type:complete len:481 (-) Transcript_29362:70-1512(-)